MEFLPLQIYVPGDGLNTTIQSAVDAAGLPPRGVVWINASYAGTDSYNNPKNVPIFDMRGIGSTSFGGGGGTSAYATNFSNQTTVIITGATHGLGTADLGVFIYDSSTGTRNIVIPNTVSIDSTSFDVTVTFVQSQSGRIVIVG